MKLARLMSLFVLGFFAASVAQAEYIVLRNGQRLAVTSYQIVGDHYRLQMNGGFAEVAASEVVAVEPEELFAPLPAVENPQQVQETLDDLIRAAAKRYSVDPDLISSIIAAESNFNPKAVSRRNARGLMQLMPATASNLGVRNAFDPRENIDAGTRYFRDLLQLYRNDLTLSLAAYNAGPERVQFYGRRVPPFSETISYIRRVQRTYAQRKSATLPKNFAANSSTGTSALHPQTSSPALLQQVAVHP